MSEIWEIIQTNFVVIIMVLTRVSGIFTFNPIFGRQNVPQFVKAGASIMLTLVMVAGGGMDYTLPTGLFPFLFDMFKELLVGAVLGLFVNIMLTVFALAGEIVDMQLGLAMARSYDPTYGTVGISTKIYDYWFVLYFFAVGGHLSYIELFAISYETIPIGFESFDINIAYILVSYFETVLTLGVKLAMPVMAASLVTEFCIGVMMKAVPSIHVFVVNIQIKLLVGFVVLTASCGAISEFMGKLMSIMFENLHGLVENMTL